MINKENITHEGLFAKHFNTYFAQVETNLEKTIETYFLEKSDSIQPESPLSVNELKDAFFSLKINKSSGYDDISLNAFRNCFGPLLKSFMHLFNLSLKKRIFPDDLKIA